MSQESAAYHVPVMLRETVDGLGVRPGGVYLDLTFGGGGHSREVLRRLGPEGRLLGFDQDLDARERAIPDSRFTFVRSNFRWLRNWLAYYGIGRVDGILADLGVSSHHLDETARGFSFRGDAPLDMRMNQRARLTAREVVMEYPEERLADVLYLYGELRDSRRLAAAIVSARTKGGVETTGALAAALEPVVGRGREKKDMARVFQALRIEVNGEMEALARMLGAARDALRPGGRLCVLTYHSLEDRMVKNMIKTGDVAGKAREDMYGRRRLPFRDAGHGVTTPSAQEQQDNPRSRSAKLRVADLLRGLSINGMWFRRQLGVLGLILLGVILYITNRYQAQREMIEEDRLRDELQDWKFRSMTRGSELTLRCRQSQLEEQLRARGDSTLQPSNEPPYVIKEK